MEVNGYTILQAARNTGRDLTTKQVNQILRRRDQLVKESRNLQRDKARQMDMDWSWWYNIDDYEE